MMFALLAIMSVLDAMWTAPLRQADTASARGWKNKIEVEEGRAARSRSPRRRSRGAKALLLSWAKGDTSAVQVWRVAHAIVTEDGTDCGYSMGRLAGLASATSSSEKTARRH